MINESTQLQQMLDGKMNPTQELASGEYHVHGTDNYLELNLVGSSRYGAVIHVHETPIKIGHCSHISNLTFHAAPELPALFLLDHSSRASIFDNFLNAPNGGLGGKPSDFERTCYGILTTGDSNSEDNWNVRVYGNEFRWFKAGIETRTPGISPIGNRLKGTSRWLIANNGFDGCEFGLRLVRPELFHIEWNHFQMHHQGIRIEGGHTNWLTRNDFERGYSEFDIAFDENTCHTLSLGNTAPMARVSPQVKNRAQHNVYLRQVRKLNIWAHCAKGS